MFNLDLLIRDNVKQLVPYSSARDEFTGNEGIFLDANENPFDTGYNRYPDPYQRKLKERIAGVKKVSFENIFLGNGSDEVIDLLFRAFCNPQKDHIIITPPTYGMYKVSAGINDVQVVEVPLIKSSDQVHEVYLLDTKQIIQAVTPQTKLIFLCSPNNPTANSLRAIDIEYIIQQFGGIVVIDEAYIDFSNQTSWSQRLHEFPNMVVMQTLSKAWGLAGIRLGMAYAHPSIVQILNKIKPPYNVNQLTQEAALKALQNIDKKEEWIKSILQERMCLAKQLSELSSVIRVFPSDANFLLVEFTYPIFIYNQLVKENIIVRNRSRVTLCEGCLRISVGTPLENEHLIKELKRLD